jgi:predicted glycosyltransferase
MKYIFELNHPKHYYQFKYIMQMLKRDGHMVHVLARDKDVLLNVLQEENVSYEIFGLHAKNMRDKVLATPKLVLNYYKIAKREKPDVIVSKASLYGTLVARLIGAKAIIFPDSEVVTLTNKVVVPMCSTVITPATFGLDFGKKHIRIKGFFEDCYLAPSVFQPKEEVVKQYGLKKPYALFRFVGWYANHDVNNSGFTAEQQRAMLQLAEQKMHVYISSEKKLPDDLEKYKLPTPAAEIHSVLAHADLYVGDSQTMATEAALLGTPAIRSNSFVGPNDMTNFIVLEKQYNLLRNIRDYDGVVAAIQDMSQNPCKQEWVAKKNAYFQQVGDANQQIYDIITK